MSAITQASAQVAKTVAVSTGKVTNAKSMMVWKPHGNKYVFVFDATRERDARGETGDARREGGAVDNQITSTPCARARGKDRATDDA